MLTGITTEICHGNLHSYFSDVNSFTPAEQHVTTQKKIFYGGNKEMTRVMRRRK
jgi:hypothetical protein